jgi:hypothetical protein
MAQTRVQVGRLNAPTQSNLRPQAAPVETYVRPPETQQQPSQLSQFLTAITPAIEADANLRKAERLKREREIETGQRRIHASQLDQQAKIIEAELDRDWTTNEQEYLQMNTADVLQKRRDFVSDELDKLKSTDIDPMLLDQFSINMEALTNVWGKTVYEPAKIKENKRVNLQTLGTSIISQVKLSETALTTDPQAYNNGAESIKTLVDGFMTAYGSNFTKAEVNDELVRIAHEQRETNPNSALVQYLDSALSNNQFGIPRHLDKYTDIKKAQASSASVGFSVAKDNAVTTMATDAMSRAFNGDASGINMETDVSFTVNGKSTTHKFSRTDYANVAEIVYAKEFDKVSQLPKETPEQKAIFEARLVDLKRKKLEMYASVGADTPQIAEAKRSGVKIWSSGDIDTLDAEKEDGTKYNQSLEAAKDAYLLFEEVYAYQGEAGLQTFLEDEDQRTMFHTIRSNMKVGNEDFKSSLQYARRYKPEDAPKYTFTKEDLKDTIDTSWFTFLPFVNDDVAESINVEAMRPAVQKRFGILKSVDPFRDDDDVFVQAVKEVSDGYVAAPASDGEFTVIKRAKNLTSAKVDKGIAVLGALNEEAMANKDFRSAINLKLNTKDLELPLGGEAFLPSFVLEYETNPNNDNMLDVRAIAIEDGERDYSNTWFIPMGVSLPSIAEGRKSKFIEDTVKAYNADVKAGKEIAEPTEDDETPNLTPSLSMPNIFEEFPAEQMFEDVGQELKDVVGSVGDAVVAPANAATTIMEDEGFSYTPYDDMGKQSVGHGLQIESLEDDEKALIADINNVQPEESAAVVALKVAKTNDFFSSEVDGFENLPESTRSGVIQMGYQLGRFNVSKEWPKFMASLKEAAQYAEGSIEQGTALAKAKFNMLYNVAEDGTVRATKWATQTADRAMKVANEVAVDVADFGSSVFESVIPKANASLVVPDEQQVKVGEVPQAAVVVDIALNKNPADAAFAYMGMSEHTREGAAAVKGFFENSVGDWNPQQQTVEEFATNQAWCGAFLAQVLRDSGIDAKSLLGKDKFNQIRAASYLKVGNEVQTTQAKAGDIMIKMHSAADRKKHKLGVAHVGVVVKVEGDEVYFIGGNTGDKVRMSSYNMTEEDVKVRRIDGASDIPTESLPSMLQLKAGMYTNKATEKVKNLFTSMYDNIFG